MKRLKVYGILMLRPGTDRQVRVIAAVRSQKEFAVLTHNSLHYIRGYASETGNEHEIKQAMAKPGVLLWTPDRYTADQEYKEW